MQYARAWLLVLGLAACGAALPALPSQGGPAWHELTTMHFIVWTDASLERGRELVQQMEWLRSVIYGVAFPDLPPGGRTFVVALRNIRESRLYTPPYHDAITVRGGPLHRPMIVMPADAYGDHYTVTHELTHAISYNAIHHQPRWFAEGLATFFETIDLDMSRGTVDVGLLRDELLASLRRPGALLPTSRILGCERMACTDDYKFYVTAWAMYAFLHYKHAEALAAFERALDVGSTDTAWQASFPALETDALDHELVNWLLYGGYAVAHFKIEKRQWPIAERAIADADVHAVRALLTWIGHPKAPELASELDAALAADTTNVLAHALDLAARQRRPAEDAARATTAAHPDDFLAWSLLVTATQPGDEHVAAVAKMCELAAQDPAIHAPDVCHKHE